MASFILLRDTWSPRTAGRDRAGIAPSACNVKSCGELRLQRAEKRPATLMGPREMKLAPLSRTMGNGSGVEDPFCQDVP